MIKPEQMKAARALLGWTQSDLAKAVGLSSTALSAIEKGTSDPRASNLEKIQNALEGAGVVFIPSNGEGIGVRLRKGVTPGQATKPDGRSSL